MREQRDKLDPMIAIPIFWLVFRVAIKLENLWGLNFSHKMLQNGPKSLMYIRGVMIPGLESIPEPDFEPFSENCDSDSDSSSNSYWNRFQSGIDSKGGIDSSAGIGSRVGIDSNQRMGST